jgi:hypothetical protein
MTGIDGARTGGTYDPGGLLTEKWLPLRLRIAACGMGTDRSHNAPAQVVYRVVRGVAPGTAMPHKAVITPYVVGEDGVGDDP